MTTTIVSGGAKVDKILALIDATLAEAVLTSLARSKNDRFANVVAHDPVDQTPAVWRSAPTCENA